MFPNKPLAITIFRLIFLGTSFYGVLNTSELIWTFGDLGVGIMAWLNIIAILILSNQGIKLLKDYEEQKKQGLDPVFNPATIGIKSEVWEAKYREKRGK